MDWDRRIVTIRRQTFRRSELVTKPKTKGREIRHVPILQASRPRARAPHVRYEEDQKSDSSPVRAVVSSRPRPSATQPNGTPSCPNLSYRSDRHGLRHTGATWLADAGIPLHVLQSILGHKSLETTRGYLHPDTGISPTQPHNKCFSRRPGQRHRAVTD